MKKSICCIFIIVYLLLLITNFISAQNPIILDQFTADPSARVFDGKVYVYPSHDISGVEGKGRMGWFVMEDYHVFSSSNLINWTDHGIIVSQNNVDWVDSNAYSMWAPDCIFKNEKYYFYFPTIIKDTIIGKGFGIGVAVSDNPYGPFIPEPEPIKNVHGIDPNPFIDKDGQAYLYWALRKIFVAKLKNNMLELDSEPQVIEKMPAKGLIEGPYLFEHNGIYYMTYPHVENKTERLEYAMGDNPLGPFKFAGVIMDESPSGCWTNHQSIIQFKDQWYLFYHDNDLSPKFDKNRSTRVDSLFFNENGTIQKVIPTLRGVGLNKATEKIQIDRYSLLSEKGTTIELLNTNNTSAGWKTILTAKDAWLKYNSVDFGNNKLKSVIVKAKSIKGGVIAIKTNKVNGLLVAKVKIKKNQEWKEIKSKLIKTPQGIQNLIIMLDNTGDIEIDWIRFE